MNPEGTMIPGAIVTKYGWVCPKCGGVYAPFVPQCMTCGSAKAEGKTEDKQLLTEQKPGPRGM